MVALTSAVINASPRLLFQQHLPTSVLVVSQYLRQVIKIFDSASGPDRDSVDFIVQAVEEEAEELLSVLLAGEDTK